jgi:hypothetical protein
MISRELPISKVHVSIQLQSPPPGATEAFFRFVLEPVNEKMMADHEALVGLAQSVKIKVGTCKGWARPLIQRTVVTPATQ